jgi:hypothetical protein
MPGTLAAIIITVMFFKTALDAGKNPVHKPKKQKSLNIIQA